MNKINLFLTAFKQHKKAVLITVLTIVVFGLFAIYFVSKNQQSRLNNQELATQDINANQDMKQESSSQTSFLGQLLENVDQEDELAHTESEQADLNSSTSITTTDVSTSTDIVHSDTLSAVASPTPTINQSPVASPTPTINVLITGENAATLKVLPIVIEDTSTPETIEKAKQFATLKSKCPVTTANFEIDFSYSEDKFNVFIVLDKEAEFWKWLGENYPALDVNSFILTALP